MDLSQYWLPLLIFLAEVCVVTFGTLRIIFVARGQKILAPVLGFFEVFIWLLAMCQIMQNLSDWSCLLGFALGFTLGNYLGIIIEQRLAMGTVSVRIVTHVGATALVYPLRGANFGVTTMEGKGATGKVQIVMTVIKRKQLPAVIEMIDLHNPGAFYAVETLQTSSDGIFSQVSERSRMVPAPLHRLMRLVMPADKQLELARQRNHGADARTDEAGEPEALILH